MTQSEWRPSNSLVKWTLARLPSSTSETQSTSTNMYIYTRKENTSYIDEPQADKQFNTLWGLTPSNYFTNIHTTNWPCIAGWTSWQGKSNLRYPVTRKRGKGTDQECQWRIPLQNLQKLQNGPNWNGPNYFCNVKIMQFFFSIKQKGTKRRRYVHNLWVTFKLLNFGAHSA